MRRIEALSWLDFSRRHEINLPHESNEQAINRNMFAERKMRRMFCIFIQTELIRIAMIEICY